MSQPSLFRSSLADREPTRLCPEEFGLENKSASFVTVVTNEPNETPRMKTLAHFRHFSASLRLRFRSLVSERLRVRVEVEGEGGGRGRG